MARERRPRDDEDEDDRPVRKRRPAEDDEDEDEPRPMKKARACAADEDEDDEPPRPRKRRDDDDGDDEDDRPRKKFKRKKSGSKGLLIGMIVGSVVLVGAVVLLIVLLGGGSSPKTVMQRLIRAAKVKDYGVFYDNMSSRLQQQFAGQRPPFGGTVTATDPRQRYIELMKSEERLGANLFARETDATVLTETITGETAKVRIRSQIGLEIDVPFVKENGTWKLGF